MEILAYATERAESVNGLILIAPPVRLRMKYSIKNILAMLAMGFRVMFNS